MQVVKEVEFEPREDEYYIAQVVIQFESINCECTSDVGNTLVTRGWEEIEIIDAFINEDTVPELTAWERTNIIDQAIEQLYE